MHDEMERDLVWHLGITSDSMCDVIVLEKLRS